MESEKGEVEENGPNAADPLESMDVVLFISVGFDMMGEVESLVETSVDTVDCVGLGMSVRSEETNSVLNASGVAPGGT